VEKDSLMIRILSLTLALVLACFAPAQEKPAGITIDKEKKAVIVDAKIAPRKLDDPKFKGVQYPIEVIACWAYPKGEKSHETVVTFDVKPSEIHKALETLGLKPGKPVYGDTTDKSEGPEVNIFLEVPSDGGTKRVPIEKALVDPASNKPMPKVKWRFTGSKMIKPDPDKDETVYGADQSGTLIAIFPVTDKTVFQTSLTMKEEKYLKLETNTKVLPKEGTAIKLIIEAAK
jgi:hypothetical protein